jgi:preprotein translocase subunit SecA
MHFEIRKHLLEYDNVANQQRQVIYGLRKNVLADGEMQGVLEEFADYISDELYDEHIPDTKDNVAFAEACQKLLGGDIDLGNTRADDPATYKKAFLALLAERIVQRKEELGEHFDGLTRFVLINAIDSRWKEHLLQMDYLRDSVGLRGYGQKDPLVEYKKESFGLFTGMYSRIQYEALDIVMHVQIRQGVDVAAQRRDPRKIKEERKDIFESGDSEREERKSEPVRRSMPKVGRNDPCPCGSGKKYKSCHGT